MAEYRHNAYIGLAGVIAVGGISWLTAHHAHHHVFLDRQRVGALILLAVAGLMFLGVILSALPGLRRPKQDFNEQKRRGRRKGATPSSVPMRSPNEPEQRAITSATPEDLWIFYEGRTDMQAYNLIKHHVGQWMQLSGRVKSVSGWSGHSAMVTLERPPSGTVCLFFDDEFYRDQLSSLQQGDEIGVRGKLETIQASSMDLSKCILVGVGPEWWRSPIRPPAGR